MGKLEDGGGTWAVSVELLSFYHLVFEHSCDAIYALSTALSTYYNR